MKTLLAFALALLSLTAAWAGGPPVAPAEGETITWMTLEQAQEACKKHPKKILIDVYTDWCGWCKVMDKKTFTQPQIASYLSANFYCVKLNAERSENIIFRGQVYGMQPGQRVHSVVFELIKGEFGYPTTVYLDEKLNVLQHISSYLDPKQIEPVLHFFADNAYKKTPWDQYEKSFKSSL